MSSPLDSKPTRPRGIYLLPNLFTTAALFAGFYAIIAATQNHFEFAAIAIFIAMIFDGLDGRVARMTNTQSAFGAEYDSLSDMVSFGLAPALVMFEWSLADLAQWSATMGKLGWLAAFVYTAAAALRLARFNTQVGIADKRYFQGLASPAAAAVLMGLVWLCASNGIEGKELSVLALILTALTGLLMVSKFSYYSFKDLDFKRKIPFMAVVAVMVLFVFLSIDTPLMLFVLFAVYTLSGPALAFLRLFRKRQRRPLSGSDGSSS